MTSLLVEYVWVLLSIVLLEGILTVDNSVVLAVLMKNLPENQRKKELFYGLTGALLFRCIALFMISCIIDLWQIQAIGAMYLLYISGRNVYKRTVQKEIRGAHIQKQRDFWWTLLKIEIIDLAFAMDSIFVAVTLTMNLPKTNLASIGELDVGQFALILVGSMMGIIMMRFTTFTVEKIIKSRPKLEISLFLVVGWVGIKLAIYALSHSRFHMIPHTFPESTGWHITFWTVFIGIVMGGWIFSNRKSTERM
ncbi:hypothetical protein CN345_28090 [Bacillus thuringiensis]|uniref:TerC family protein n=1 Tax=Bacillus thuringiensis TaxID=1428 RepID=UPI000BF991C3|nr:hypothetical protein [Bacillus thuringiensis]PEZ24875.1 hypothetical protein CN345_28090 [Bacillus thuringiensis]PGY62597.1 hypothetical protein COE09_04840 [Bacillus thuringiensis]